ncbi:MAG: sulfur carrier protein ThiS [Verrucomicrobiaceae bacterium]|nr:sulfur carrier protein ThiS [Verrucomicrobiaceae bacterium]
MTLKLNGESKEFDASEMALTALLSQLGFGERPVLVEHNGIALRQREHAATVVADGDQLEIILVVAGG